MDIIDKSIGDVATTAADVTKTTVNLVETAIRRVWTILDAASQKDSPGEYLSPQAIHSIQGQQQ